jgi:cytochrome bd-type quinol oxidase subunit 1
MVMTACSPRRALAASSRRGELNTASAATVSATWLWISLVGFIALYGTLGTVDLILMLRYSRKELEPERTDADTNASVPAVQY